MLITLSTYQILLLPVSIYMYTHISFTPINLFTPTPPLSLSTMKKLIQRLSRVPDPTHYSLLRSESRASTRPRRCHRLRLPICRRSGGVPEGHLPVYVGEESERFIVNAKLLNHPIFVKLLNISAQEYGYGQKGVLRIACHVVVFEKVLEALRVDEVSPDVLELVESTSVS